MKLAFTSVPFRHNSACVIQKWLRFKKVITVRLAYKSCILVNCLKQRSYIAIRKNISRKQSFLIINTISYFLVLVITWQFHLPIWQGVGPSPFLLFTKDYLSENSHSHASLILITA